MTKGFCCGAELQAGCVQRAEPLLWGSMKRAGCARHDWPLSPCCLIVLSCIWQLSVWLSRAAPLTSSHEGQARQLHDPLPPCVPVEPGCRAWQQLTGGPPETRILIQVLCEG